MNIIVWIKRAYVSRSIVLRSGATISNENGDALVTDSGGVDVSAISTSGALVDDSDALVPSQKAVKAYVDGLVATLTAAIAAITDNDAADTGEELSIVTTLSAAEIVGTAAGDIGHSAGAILLAAAPSGYVYEFLGAMLFYDYATAAYTGGGDDCVIRVGTTAVTDIISKANLLGAAGDKVLSLKPIATELNIPVHTTINLAGTAFTNPGTAAGVLRCHIRYRKHTTNL